MQSVDESTAAEVDQGTRESRESSLLGHVDRIVRDPHAVLDDIQDDKSTLAIVHACIAVVLVGAAMFGGAMGTMRGGIQVLLAGAKLPLVLLFSTVFVAPAVAGINFALGRATTPSRDGATCMLAAARTAVVLSGLTPVVVLAVRLGISYHKLALLSVMCAGLAGLSGLAVFVRASRRVGSFGRVVSAALSLMVFALVGTQLSWSLRPFILRPKADTTMLVRKTEGSFVQSVGSSFRSTLSEGQPPWGGAPENRGESEGSPTEARPYERVLP